MRTGRITLLYKGVGSKHDLSNYRPITLLKCDCKLLAKALAMRWGPLLAPVLSPDQTAFLPGRWIGDNVLTHLEEISYLQEAQQPGCTATLDFSKAYDRVDRQWILRAMNAVGFQRRALRWAELLLSRTVATLMYNGWQTQPFPVNSGAPQGGPLSPLLYNICTHPLQCHLQRQAALGAFLPMLLPGGYAALVCHQHADDLALHARS